MELRSKHSRGSMVGIIPTMALLLQAAPVECQAAAESDSGPLVLRLESSGDTYAIGDSIRLRLTLRNTLAEAMTLRNGPLMGLVRLYVYDAAGTQLEQGISAWPYQFFSGPRTRSLGPWQQTTFKAADGGQWISLRDLGYNIRASGRYAIVGIPQPGLVQNVPAETMNPARITVTIQPWSPPQWGIAALLAAGSLLAVAAFRARRNTQVRQ